MSSAADVVVINPPLSHGNERQYIKKRRNGKISTAPRCKSRPIIKWTLGLLIVLTLYAFFSLDFGNIDMAQAVARTFENIRTMFGQPRLIHLTFTQALWALALTLSLGVLSTIFGAIIAFFLSLLCARNLTDPKIGNVVRGIVAALRAVPSILWVLIFTVAVGLGGTAAVAGLTLHSMAYLVKAYSESIEEMDAGVIEALRASGAGFWQIVFQAVLPSSIGYMTAWTFLRFEINFINAIAMGAAAGAGGIGFDLFMAGNFYFSLRELGALTYLIMIAVIILEIFATQVKKRVK